MTHVLFECLPFLAGCAYGGFAPLTGYKNLWPNLLIGAAAAAIAGELTGGLGIAFMALILDSAGSLGGCLLVRFGRRFAIGRFL